MTPLLRCLDSVFGTQSWMVGSGQAPAAYRRHPTQRQGGTSGATCEPLSVTGSTVPPGGPPGKGPHCPLSPGAPGGLLQAGLGDTAASPTPQGPTPRGLEQPRPPRGAQGTWVRRCGLWRNLRVREQPWAGGANITLHRTWGHCPTLVSSAGTLTLQGCYSQLCSLPPFCRYGERGPELLRNLPKSHSKIQAQVRPSQAELLPSGLTLLSPSLLLPVFFL